MTQTNFDRSLFNNIITRTDSYKFPHWLQYPPNTRTLYDYITPRGGDFPYTLFAGLQMYLPKLSEGFDQHDIDAAEEDVNMHFGQKVFNRAGWEYILNKHGGILPLRFMALPEGKLFPIKDKNKNHIPLVTVENTDFNSSNPSFWLPGHMETSTLRAIWYPTTVATNSFACKVKILEARIKSCDDPLAGLEFALHDFGGRGVSSGESAEIGGTGHLINFWGTDTFECLRMVHRIYHMRMAGYSVPASEHSTITLWRRGKVTNEDTAYENMLIKFASKAGGIVAVVSDSYDLWAAIQHIWGGSLKQKVLDSGCRIVVRPDCYDEQTEILTEHGWVKFPELQPGTKVAQMHDDWTVDFTNPLKYVAQDYTGDMVKLTDQKGRLDLLVTPNHRMVLTDLIGRLSCKEAHEASFHHNSSIPRVAPAIWRGTHLHSI